MNCIASRNLQAAQCGGRSKTLGFTLLELMITILIMGLLAGFAYPNYKHLQYKKNRYKLLQAVLMISKEQEAYFQKKLTYANTLTGLGYESGRIEVAGFFITSVASSRAGTEIVSCTGVGDQVCDAYRIEAIQSTAPITLQGGKISVVGDPCYAFWFSNDGKTNEFSFAGGDRSCWPVL